MKKPTRSDKHYVVNLSQKITAVMMLERGLTKNEVLKLSERIEELDQLLKSRDWTKEPTA